MNEGRPVLCRCLDNAPMNFRGGAPDIALKAVFICFAVEFKYLQFCSMNVSPFNKTNPGRRLQHL